MDGSDDKFMNIAALERAPVFLNSFMKKFASSLVIPMAPNTTAKLSPVFRVFACLAICDASTLCGRPEPENMGSFCPLTSVFIPSIVDIPV